MNSPEIKRLEKSGIERILVRGTSWVGDAVMTLPALTALRDNFPHSHIAVMARPWVLPVYAGHPAVDEVLVYPAKTGTLAKFANLPGLIRRVKKERFDLAVLFQNAFEAAMFAFLCRIPHRLGYDTDGRRALLTHPLSAGQRQTAQHQVFHYLSLVGAPGWQTEYRAPALHVSERDRGLAGRLLAKRGIPPDALLIGMGPGATYGPSKRWPPERYAEVGDRAVENWGARVVILGSEGERDVCAAVENSMRKPAVDLSGDTALATAMGIIWHCRLFVSNDSGLMHVAAALGVPTVAIFGSTDPEATGPFGALVRVARKATDCSPCFLRTCPIDFPCMLQVTPEEVWEDMAAMKKQAGGFSSPRGR